MKKLLHKKNIEVASRDTLSTAIGIIMISRPIQHINEEQSSPLSTHKIQVLKHFDPKFLQPTQR